MAVPIRSEYAGYANTTRHYHRGIKQFCGVERCQTHGVRAQRSHIGLTLRAFLRLESHCFHGGISWFAAKTQFIFHQKVKTTGFSRSALAAPIGPLGIITEVGKVWFSSLARGAKWVDFSPLRLARTHQL